MNDKIFIDSNILIYAYSTNELIKRDVARKVIENNVIITISTQVINEFINITHKKHKIPLNDLNVTLRNLNEYLSIQQISVLTIEQALNIAHKYKFSYYDSLILSSALEHNCSIIYTEDMHHNQLIENKLLIKNPFI